MGGVGHWVRGRGAQGGQGSVSRHGPASPPFPRGGGERACMVLQTATAVDVGAQGPRQTVSCRRWTRTPVAGMAPLRSAFPPLRRCRRRPGGAWAARPGGPIAPFLNAPGARRVQLPPGQARRVHGPGAGARHDQGLLRAGGRQADPAGVLCARVCGGAGTGGRDVRDSRRPRFSGGARGMRGSGAGRPCAPPLPAHPCKAGLAGARLASFMASDGTARASRGLPRPRGGGRVGKRRRRRGDCGRGHRKIRRPPTRPPRPRQHTLPRHCAPRSHFQGHAPPARQENWAGVRGDAPGHSPWGAERARQAGKKSRGLRGRMGKQKRASEREKPQASSFPQPTPLKRKRIFLKPRTLRKLLPPPTHPTRRR